MYSQLNNMKNISKDIDVGFKKDIEIGFNNPIKSCQHGGGSRQFKVGVSKSIALWQFRNIIDDNWG